MTWVLVYYVPRDQKVKSYVVATWTTEPTNETIDQTIKTDQDSHNNGDAGTYRFRKVKPRKKTNH